MVSLKRESKKKRNRGQRLQIENPLRHTRCKCKLKESAKISFKFLKVVQFDHSRRTTRWQMWSGRGLLLRLTSDPENWTENIHVCVLGGFRSLSLSWPSHDPSCSTHGQPATPYCKNATRWPPYPHTGRLCGYGLTRWRPLSSIFTVIGARCVWAPTKKKVQSALNSATQWKQEKIAKGEEDIFIRFPLTQRGLGYNSALLCNYTEMVIYLKWIYFT